MTRLSNAEGRKLLNKKPKKSREGNRLTEYNGTTYHSKKEAHRAQELDWMVQTGQVIKYERQVPIPCVINGALICTYICDFVVLYNTGKLSYEDVKGRRSGGPYEMFKLKARLVKALLGIEIVEI